MANDDIERLELAASRQLGRDISTTVAVTPGALIALCGLARAGLAAQAIGEDDGSETVVV